jgi:hypothetical protein
MSEPWKYYKLKKPDTRQAWYFSPIIPATWEVEIGRAEVWDPPEQKLKNPLRKRLKAKRADGVAQIVECLPSKHNWIQIPLQQKNSVVLNHIQATQALCHWAAS